MEHSSTALLIPCYNAERYLLNLRKQVDALDPRFDEIVVVDDGSADATVARARELGFDIKPLGKNRGPGGARNAAAKLTNAEWIHFLDADDEIDPGYLGKVLPSAGDEVDVMLSTTVFVDEITRDLVIRWEFADDDFRENPLRSAILHPVPLHSSLIRRTAFERAGGFDENLRCWEDGDLHVRLGASGARFRCIEDVLAWSPRHLRGAGGDSLYCWRCRLQFLRRYVGFVPMISRADLCSEAIRTASNLCAEGDISSVGRALDLASELGWQGPESRHPVLFALASIPSRRMRKLLFVLQMWARGRGGDGRKQNTEDGGKRPKFGEPRSGSTR